MDYVFPVERVLEYTKVIVTITVVAYYIVCIRPFGPFGLFVFTLSLIDSSELAKKRCFEKWYLNGSARMHAIYDAYHNGGSNNLHVLTYPST